MSELGGGPGSFFVVLEGIDRCGKNRQAELLSKRLSADGTLVSTFSTPDYGCSTGQLISSQLCGGVHLASVLTGQRSPGDALALECLQVANRYEVAAKIRDRLVDRETVVCVRWWQSAYLYGVDDGIDPRFIEDACSFLPQADVHVLINVDPEAVAHRTDEQNRYEADRAKQARLAQAYLKMWTRRRVEEGDRRWHIVPGDNPPEVVHEHVWRALGEVWNKRL